ncbi:MAG: hypothetical protein JSU70_05740 [Phycisphaerales bacterium]|nr:MAG: hypothetical protein JSU70_05740 [Phycisphaerales bacterium]
MMDRQYWIRSNTASIVCAMLLTLALIPACGTAQTSLGDIISQQGLDKAVGLWAATTDDGQRVLLSYQWELDRHIVMVHFRMDTLAYRSMILYQAGENKVIEVGGDNRGTVVKGTWDVSGGKAVLKSQRTDPNGQTSSMGMTLSMRDDDSLTMAFYAIDGDELVGDPWVTLQFKRQTMPARM